MDSIGYQTRVVNSKGATPPPVTSGIDSDAATVENIIACATYAALVGARGRELTMLRDQWSGRSRRRFDSAMRAVAQGIAWAEGAS